MCKQGLILYLSPPEISEQEEEHTRHISQANMKRNSASEGSEMREFIWPFLKTENQKNSSSSSRSVLWLSTTATAA